MLRGKIFSNKVSERRLLLFEIGDEFLFPVAQPLPFERGAYARPQQDRVEGLGQIILGAGFDAADDAVKFVEGGNHDDGNVAGMLRRLEPAQHLEAAHFRHDEIEQDEIELFPDDEFQCRSAVRCGRHLMPLAYQPAFQDVAI